MLCNAMGVDVYGSVQISATEGSNMGGGCPIVLHNTQMGPKLQC